MPESQTNQPQESGFVPASFEKRTAAWMGIAYALMFLFVVDFAIYTGGRLKLKTCPGGTACGVFALTLSAAGVLFGLILGWPALLAAFQR